MWLLKSFNRDLDFIQASQSFIHGNQIYTEWDREKNRSYNNNIGFSYLIHVCRQIHLTFISNTRIKGIMKTIQFVLNFDFIFFKKRKFIFISVEGKEFIYFSVWCKTIISVFFFLFLCSPKEKKNKKVIFNFSC